MTTIAKQNFRPLSDLFEELFTGFPVRNQVFQNGAMPPVNIHETEDAYHIELVAPGLKKEDFKVNVEKGMLTISYEKQQEDEKNNYKTHRKEFSLVSFKRSFHVEDKINVDGIKAMYENGVLKLLLPKREELKVMPKEITIQ